MGGGKKRNDVVDELDKLKKLVDEKYQDLYTIQEKLDKKSKVYSLLSSTDNNVVFKKTLCWDAKQKKVNPKLEKEVLCEIAGIGNAFGGSLVIGVDETGTILGLDNDYEMFEDKNSRGFEEYLKSIIEKHFEDVNFDGTIKLNVRLNLSLKFHLLEDGKEICICTIHYSNHTLPIFVKINDEQRFYIRKENKCNLLDVKKFHDHIIQKYNL